MVSMHMDVTRKKDIKSTGDYIINRNMKSLKLKIPGQMYISII